MNCKTCAGPCCIKGSRIEGDCENYVPWTNASRIRAMSDEELAEFLTRYVWHEDDIEGDFLSHLVADTLGWLKSEAQEGE